MRQNKSYHPNDHSDMSQASIGPPDQKLPSKQISTVVIYPHDQAKFSMVSSFDKNWLKLMRCWKSDWITIKISLVACTKSYMVCNKIGPD